MWVSFAEYLTPLCCAYPNFVPLSSFFHFAPDWHVREFRGTVCMFQHGNAAFVVHL